MTIEVLKPATLKELQEIVNDPVPRPAVGHSHAQTQVAAYRGCASSTWRLDHSLARTGGDSAAKELTILDDFRSKSTRDIQIAPIDSTVDLQLMSYAQHHGVPTRLLDWSRTQDTALHFATFDYRHASEDGAVWIVNINCVHEGLSLGARTTLSPERVNDPGIIGAARFTTSYPTLASFDSYFVAGKYMPLAFFEPMSVDDRITAQGSLFSIVADAATSVQDVLEGLDGACRKVIISPALKRKLRENLDARGMHEAFYFRDPDGVGAFLSRAHRDP